jgi:hypothetical protein
MNAPAANQIETSWMVMISATIKARVIIAQNRTSTVSPPFNIICRIPTHRIIPQCKTEIKEQIVNF